MRITELLKKESIELGVKVSDKEEAVDRLVSLMDAGGRLKDTAGYKEGILVSVRLDYDGRLTDTIPAYGDGWKVTAWPDGRLRLNCILSGRACGSRVCRQSAVF